MKKIISCCILVMLLLASAVSLAIVPASAQEVVPGDKNGDKLVSEEELAGVILPYMLGEPGHRGLDEVREIAHIHVYYPKPITDSAKRDVMIYMPIKRIITLTSDSAESVRTLGEVDNIVGVTETIKNVEEYFPELQNVESVGTWKQFNYEQIVNIARDDTNVIVPDILVISYVSKVSGVEEGLGLHENIAVVGLDLYKRETQHEELLELGYLLEREEEAQDFIDWSREKEEAVKNAVEGLDMPKVYIERGYTAPGDTEFKTYGEGSAINEHCEEAGGDNIAKDLPYQEAKNVEWGWVINQTPDVIVKEIPNTYLPGWVDTSVAEEKRNEVMDRIGAEDIPAVNNDSVYVHTRSINYGLQRVVGLTYWAKIFHPDAEGLYPEAVCEEYLEFQGPSMVGYPGDRIIVYNG